jgi:glycosyltransferase involved in cell wall biosynthesis
VDEDSSRLAVTIDASAIPGSTGGVGRYLTGLLAGLAARDCHPTLFAASGDTARWLGTDPRLVVRDVAPAPRPVRLAWEQVGLPGRIRKARPAVHHSPHYTLPRLAAVAKVVTIHDMTFISHPEWHQRSKVRFFRFWIEQACRHADALVCVSNVTAEKLLEFRRPRGQVVVAPHGVDLSVFSPGSTGEDAAEVLTQHGVAGPYVLFLGTVEPRKDIPGLIRAFDAISDKHRDVSLVIGGAPGWDETRVEAATRRARHPERIRRVGYVPERQVPVLLRQAAVVAYPSFEEGFGLPVLEALACGAPTITTRGTAMEEASGGAARLVAPGDSSELAQAIDDVLTAGVSAAERERGQAVAARHTWVASADKHLEAYRLACARRA